MLEKYRNVIGEILAPFIILGIIVFLSVGRQPAMGELNVEKLVKAIRISEGTGSRFPYGIKSVPCYSQSECKAICIKTVRHYENDFTRHGDGGINNFIQYLGPRYVCGRQGNCPAAITWEKNVKRLYENPNPRHTTTP